MLRAIARTGLRMADGVALAMSPHAQAAGDALISVLFHSLRAERSALDGAGDEVCVEDFRTFVGAMLDSGWQAVTPAQVDAGLPRGGRHLVITFDDGYFNNTLALPVLEEFRVPATFFISSGPVQRQQAFWWDAYRRGLATAGVPAREQPSRIRKLKTLTPRQIDQYLGTRFGDAALQVHGDGDRPFTPAELMDFARSPWVHIGNHTCDHAILTNCPPDEIDRQVRGCQQALKELVGYTPIAIAYPNGNFSPAILDAARAAGLRLGFSVLPHRNKLPLSASDRMALGRFVFEAGQDARAQCRKFSAGFVPSHAVKTLIHSPRRASHPVPAARHV